MISSNFVEEQHLDENRQSVLNLWSNGLFNECRHTLEYLLINHHDPSNILSQIDIYRYSLVLETLGEHVTGLQFINFHLGKQNKHLMHPLIMALLAVVKVRVLGALKREDEVLEYSVTCLNLIEEIRNNNNNSKNLINSNYLPFIVWEDLISSVHSVIAKVYLAREDVTNHQKHLQLSAKTCRFSSEITAFSSSSTYQKLELLYGKEKYPEFINEYYLIMESDLFCGVQFIKFTEMLAVCYSQCGQIDQLNSLITPFQSAVTKSASIQYIQGLSYITQGIEEKARLHFGQALITDPTHVPSRLALGHAYAALGDHELATECYARIIKRIDPSCTAAWIAMAAEGLRIGRLKFVPFYIQEALKVAGQDDFGILNEMGIYLYKMGQFEEAHGAFEKALLCCGVVGRVSVERNIVLCLLRRALVSRRVDLLRECLRLAHICSINHPILNKINCIIREEQEAQNK